MSKSVFTKPWGSDLIQVKSFDLPSFKFRWFQSVLKNQKGKVLEVGCNGGRFIKTLSWHLPSLEYFGCDIDEDAIRRISPSNSIHLCVADGCSLPYSDNFFDFVIIVDYLEHVKDHKLSLIEIFRVLKPGGQLIAFIPCEGQFFSIYNLHRLIFRWNVKEKTCGHYPLKRNSLKEWFQSHGYPFKTKGFSYHFLGQLMDFSFFWLVAKSRRISNWWWSKNKFYFKDQANKGINSRIANTLISLANGLTYLESRILWRIPFGAMGWHMVANKPNLKI